MRLMIRTTNHTFHKWANTGKIDKLNLFLIECHKTAQIYLDYLWDNKIDYTIKDKPQFFDIKNDDLDIPSMLSNVDIESKIGSNIFNDNPLSGRVRKCILTQVCGILGASCEKQRKRLFVFNSLCEEGFYNEKLYEKIQQNIPVKPNIENINFEFNSICCDYEKSENSTSFNGYIQLSSLGKGFGKIRIPIKFHRMNKKYKDWEMKPSFLIGKDFINIRWEKKEPELRTEGKTLGADQGAKTVISLSDRQVSSPNKDGYDLNKVMDIMSRKRKGSKAFRKAQAHRKNIIHWSINQLNLDGIKEIKLEEVINIGYKNPMGRKMSHWTNTIIRDKLIDRGLLLGVQVVLQSSTYRSQRCSNCGLVHKSNRKGKYYCCSNCGFEEDADYNASLNHEATLHDIPVCLRRLNLNRTGFFWKEDGFYDLDGVQFTVELGPENKYILQRIC